MEEVPSVHPGSPQYRLTELFSVDPRRPREKPDKRRNFVGNGLQSLTSNGVEGTFHFGDAVGEKRSDWRASGTPEDETR
ncbi:hypothetical protein EYF80_013815 [Liparis tanakae]|uniref:Uncharacterized protein n=1 Tax=Liparis tanakae TaxID=230148 RepID=A0A4Z2IFF5_9TELE|nr:hypothetical protein EYF80_013815 [Liparis tanakae]